MMQGADSTAPSISQEQFRTSSAAAYARAQPSHTSAGPVADSTVSPIDAPPTPLHHNEQSPESIELLETTSSKSTTEETPSLTHASKINSSWTDGWLAETISCVVAMLALASLIATLRYFDGSILTDLPLHVSINTLIAVIGALIKAMILVPVAECRCHTMIAATSMKA